MDPTPIVCEIFGMFHKLQAMSKRALKIASHFYFIFFFRLVHFDSDLLMRSEDWVPYQYVK